MAELDRFRDFRSGVAAPNERAQRRAASLLATAIESDRTPTTSGLRLLGQRKFGAAAVTAVVVAVTTGLFVSAPWNNAPGFLERAQAALAADPETVLHASWKETLTSTDPACTVERGPNEIWIDQTPPRRFRTIQEDSTPNSAADPGEWVCSSGTISELRGTLDSGRAYSVVPGSESGSPVLFITPYDPVQALREAISEGRAHDEGETQLDGRTVKRIRIDPPVDCDRCPDKRSRSYAYVDPDSFYPVEEHGFGSIGATATPLPGDESRDATDRPEVSDRSARFHVVRRYLTFEYLPRTAANVALTTSRDNTRP
jgi:hypothetical protein